MALALVFAGATSHAISIPSVPSVSPNHPHLLGDGLTSYHYDSEGRLESASTGQGEDAPTTKYAHNGLGQRVFKTEPLYASSTGTGNATGKNLNNLLADDDEPQGEPPGLIQQILSFFSKLWSPSTSDAEKLGFSYIYAEDGSLLGEYGSGGSNSSGTAQYIYLPTASGPMPIAAVIKGQTYAVHSDHLNTPRKLTQPDGQVAWQWAYSAFGDEQPTIGAKRFTSESTNPTTGATSIPEVTFNLRYPGQYFDPETKLHYNYFRTYAPGTGRYTQGDPIGLDGGWNRFGYVEGNPLRNSDPFGLWSLDVGGFWGPGINFTLGYDTDVQRAFFSMQFGYGVGGGVMYSPNGGLPTGQGPLTECGGDQAFLEIFGKAGISGLGANADVVTANLGSGLTTARPYGGLSWFDFSFGKKWGFKAEAAGGVQMTAVTRPNQKQGCTCPTMAQR